MDDATLLSRVKSGLAVTGTHTDTILRSKALAVKQLMLNAGVSLDQVETDLGIETLTIGVNDIWNLGSGDVSFSPAFGMLLTQLKAVSTDG